MKVVCERESLLAAFTVVATVVPSRTPKPVLQNVKFEATPQGTFLSATDLEVGIRYELPNVQLEAPGSVLLPTGRFGSILRELSDKSLKIAGDQQGTTIRGDRSQFKLPGGDPQEFAQVPSFQEPRGYDVSARVLKELIRRTTFATDTESTRYALGGVLLEFEGDKVTAVGTDGRRLAKMEGPCTVVGEGIVSEGNTIVPSRSMTLIDRAVGDSDELVRLATRGNDLLVKSSRATIFTRLLEGRFPRWRDVLPERSSGQRITIPVSELYSAIRQAAIVANEDSRGVDFHFAKGMMELSSSTAEIGQSHIQLPIAYDGDDITVALDHRYVGDFLRVLDPGTSVHLDVENAEAAALLKTDDGYSYIVMPLSRDR